MTNAKRNRGADTASDPITSMTGFFQSPAGNSFLLSQRMALEATHFWARRMRAYADQFEALAGCTSANEFVQAQSRFLERMRDDYAAETQAVRSALTPEQRGKAPGAE